MYLFGNVFMVLCVFMELAPLGEALKVLCRNIIQGISFLHLEGSQIEISNEPLRKLQ